MELLVMLVGEDAILPKPEFLDDVELRFQVPSGSVGLADPGVAVGYGDHAVNLAQGPLWLVDIIPVGRADPVYQLLTTEQAPPTRALRNRVVARIASTGSSICPVELQGKAGRSPITGSLGCSLLLATITFRLWHRVITYCRTVTGISSWEIVFVHSRCCSI